MRIIVCGPRDYEDEPRHTIRVHRVLSQIHGTWGIGCLIHGDNPGADQIAQAWAQAQGIPVEPYPIQEQDGLLNAARAGRNARMIRTSDPDGFVWFPGGLTIPKSDELMDCVTQCRNANLKEWIDA